MSSHDAVRRVELFQAQAELVVLALHAFELRFDERPGQLTRPRAGSRETHCFRVLEICIDGRDDDARFNSHEVNTDQRDTDPGIDDDTLVEHSVEDVDEGTATGRTLDSHG